MRANDPYQGDNFGSSVAIDGGIVLIGARSENTAGSNSGAAYLFDAGTGEQIAKRIASDGGQQDRLGVAVAIRGGLAVAGASYSSSSGLGSGSAYVFAADEALAVPYCFGTISDGTCPCTNFGIVGHGCANSAFPEGARLFGDRAPCVLGDDFTLWVWSSTPFQPGLFFQGDDALNGGAGLPFGDGLRCAGTHVVRLEVDAANMSGRSRTTIPIAETAGIVAGDVKYYQWWYRDPNGGPCGTGFNLSNGLAVTWAP